MSHNPPHGPPPPYYTGPGHPPPPGGSYAYVPTPVMMPVYQPPPPQPPPETTQPTYVTNYIYQQPPQPPPVEDPIEWIPATTSDVSSLTHKAYVAGREGWDGSPLCIIRSHHSGEFIPGKLAIKHRSAYVPHGGKEVPVHNFEVLCCPPHAVRWLQSSNGQVPVGAIAAGNTHSGEPLYIGRVKHMQSLTPGKVHPSHGCCYISFSGSEISHKSYEVLCKIDPAHGPPPPYYTGHPPAPGGSYTYVPTPVMMSGYQPPPPQPPEPTQSPTFVTNYIYQQPPQPPPVVTIVEEVHVQPPPQPKHHWSNLLREGAEKGLTTVGKGLAVLENNLHSRNSKPIEWIPATTSDVTSLTHKAYVAGRECSDGGPLCIIRSHHSGEFIPGKLAILCRSAYVPYGGKEIPVHNFEVLCCPSHAVRWLPSSNGQVPVGAIAAGKTHNREPLYIGRVRYMQSLTPGKVHPSHGCCYISFGGSEIAHKSYEVLCRIVG